MGRSEKLVVAAFFVAGSISGVRAQQAGAETVAGMLAAQVRTQGFTCDKPTTTRKIQKLSKPDDYVWVLKCANATYRVTRVPDMLAKVQPIQ
jgi:hypothetical protein